MRTYFSFTKRLLNTFIAGYVLSTVLERLERFVDVSFLMLACGRKKNHFLGVQNFCCSIASGHWGNCVQLRRRYVQFFFYVYENYTLMIIRSRVEWIFHGTPLQNKQQNKKTLIFRFIKRVCNFRYIHMFKEGQNRARSMANTLYKKAQTTTTSQIKKCPKSLKISRAAVYLNDC